MKASTTEKQRGARMDPIQQAQKSRVDALSGGSGGVEVFAHSFQLAV